MNTHLGHCLIECWPVILAPLRAAPALLLAACTLLGAGCKKGKESLVLANLRLERPDARAVNLKNVTLTAMPGPTKTYPLSMLSADDFAEFGLYLPENVTGEVAIVASAVPQSGCVGFRGSNIVTIAQAGVTAPVVITMEADNTCPSDGGTPGAGGTTGGGGSGGSGGHRRRRRGHRRRHRGQRRHDRRGRDWRRRRGHRRRHRGHRRRQRGQRWQRWVDGHGRHGGIPVDRRLPDVPARRQQRLLEHRDQGRRDLAERPAGRDRRRRRAGQDLELRRAHAGRRPASC